MENYSADGSTLDTLRARLPGCGFALYAYEPGGLITLEVITPEGETFSFVGATEAAAVARAMPAAAPAPDDLFDGLPAPPVGGDLFA